MQNNQPSKKRGRVVMWDTRLAITALAVGGTIGFWNLFSTQMLREPASTAQVVDPNIENPSHVIIINLPPMPTLVPQSADQSAMAGSSNSNQSSVNIPQQSFQSGMQMLLGGSSPQARSLAPAPITRTRSSQ